MTKMISTGAGDSRSSMDSTVCEHGHILSKNNPDHVMRNAIVVFACMRNLAEVKLHYLQDVNISTGILCSIVKSLLLFLPF